MHVTCLLDGKLVQVLLVTGVSGDGNLLVVARATNGTTAAAHAAGAAVAVLTDYGVNPLPRCSLVRSTPHANAADARTHARIRDAVDEESAAPDRRGAAPVLPDTHLRAPPVL